MRHNISGKHLGRDKDERKHLFRNLVGQLVVKGRVKTTITKAKAIRPLIDKLVTKAKKASLGSAMQGALGGRRDIFGFFSKEIATTFVNSVVPRFNDKTSGFSRIIHIGERSGDNAELVILEWTEQSLVPEAKKSATTDDIEKAAKTSKINVKTLKKQRKTVVSRKAKTTRSKKETTK